MSTRDEGVLRGPRQPGAGAGRNSVRLLIADAMHSYRRFVKQVLESTGDPKVVGEAVVRLAQQSKPDVVLMDIDLPDLDGLEAIRRIKAAQPGTKVIVLSAVDGETYRKAAARHRRLPAQRCRDLGTSLCCRVARSAARHRV